MSGASIRRVGYLVVAVLTVFVFYIVFVQSPSYVDGADHYKRALPIQLETVGLPIMGSDMDRMTARAPLRHEACGGALFNLTKATLDLIQKKGLTFFENAVQGRGYPEGHRYAEWKETPATASTRKSSAWAGLGCMKLNSEMVRQIERAASESGSYFTTKAEGVLLVAPHLGVVVFLYFG